MSEHEWFNEQIATYLADGLDAEERARFDEHARMCDECAAELKNARELEARMSSAFSGMIPADFEDRLVARLSSTLSRVEGRFSAPTRRFWVHPLVRKSAIAAAAAIVVSGFGYIGKEYLERGSLPTLAINGRSLSMVPDQPTTRPAPAAGNQIYTYPLKDNSAYNTEAAANLIFTGTSGNLRGVMTGAPLDNRARSSADAAKSFGLSSDTKSAVSNLKSQVQVVADPNTNSLLVTANPKDWPAVRKTLDELDKSQAAQTLATVNGNKQLGQAMQIQGGTLTGVAQTKGLASPLATIPQAGSSNTNEVVHVGPHDASAASGNNQGPWKFQFGGARASSDWATSSTWKPNESAKSETFFRLDNVTMDDTAKAGGNLLRSGGDHSNLSGQLSVNAGTLELPGYYHPPVAAGSGYTVVSGTLSNGNVTQNGLGTHSGNGYTVAGSGTLMFPADASSSATMTTTGGATTLNLNGSINLGREVALLQEVPSNPRNGNATTQSTSAATTAPQLSIRKVIREGVMEFEVDSFDSTFIQLSKIAAEEGGFIAAADSDKLPNGKVKGSVTVRVPPDHLDTLVLKLRALGELKTQRLGSRDVGREYTDLEGQLRAARAMEERLLEMIKTANGKVAELLQAERELGTWRTKIETITGQLNYYNNLISMATLTVSAYEKDIRTPASASQTEEINTGIETDDVESARAAAIKSIDDVKGRIVESTLQKLEAGQFAARIVAEVAPENAGQLVDRLKQLGRVARLDIQRRQTTTAGTVGAVAPVRIEPAPTKLIISMYNLANVAPRLTTNLNLAGDNVESIYRAILKRVADAGGRVVVSNLNRQDATNVTGSMQFEVKSGDADAVLNDIRKDVQVLRLSVNENPDTANVTTAKQAFTVQVIPTAQVPPRQTRTLHVQISDVENGMQSINAALAGVGARLGDSNLMQDTDGRSVARLGIDVPLGKVDQLLDVARKLGRVRVSESSENPQVPEGPLARARINLVLGSGDTIIPAQGGFWSSIRDGLSTSVKGLMWSLELIVIGLCLVGPWVGLVWGGWRFAKRTRRMKAEG